MAALVVTSGRVVLVNADRALSAHRWAPPSGAFTFSAGGASAAEAPFALEPDPAPPRYAWTTKARKKKNEALRHCTAGRADAADAPFALSLTPSCPGKSTSAGTNRSSSACVLACRVLGSPFAADLDAALCGAAGRAPAGLLRLLGLLRPVGTLWCGVELSPVALVASHQRDCSPAVKKQTAFASVKME